MADNVEVVQTNITIETNEAKSLVEFRYYGVNEAALAALIPRVWALEDFQDQLEADLNAALAAGTGPLQIQLNALDAVVDAEILASNAEEAARIAGDQALGADIQALDDYLTPLVLAEPAARNAAIAVETAARIAAISAATSPIIADHDALEATVAGLTASYSALAASQTALGINFTALSDEFDVLSGEFATWSTDFTTVETAVTDEITARTTADNTLHARIDGLTWKPPVRAATTAAGTLATGFENGDVIDGVTLVTGDRILIKDQAAGAENGIYVVNASGAPTRAADMNASAEVLGTIALVAEGTANGDKLFFCSTNAPITLGTTSLVFAEISGGGGVSAEILRPYIGKNLFPVEPASPNSIDDEFLTTLNTTTKWTVRAGSAGNASIVAGGLKFVGQLLITQPISGSSWQITSRFALSDLSTDVGLILVFGNVANNSALYFGGYHRAGSGGYPFFYSATMPLSGGWTATSAGASSENPTWLNYAKMMNHRVTLSSGTLTYTIAEDAADELYRKPYASNTVSASVVTGGIDVVGIYRSGGSEPGLVEFFRRTA